jgi:prevent-host-death family protein
MPVEISYREARNNFASVLDRVMEDCEVVIINRPGRKKVALISTEELSRIVEAVSQSTSQKYRHPATRSDLNLKN